MDIGQMCFMSNVFTWTFLLLSMCLVFVAGCAWSHNTSGPAMPEQNPSWAPDILDRLPAGSTQALLVVGAGPPETWAFVYVFEKQGPAWVKKFPPIEANIGREGFARPGEKKEGDGKTPSGIYPLEFVFGYQESVNTKMKYRQATTDDIWVDDARSDDYNRWMKRWETKAASFEEMRRPDDLYKLGIVAGYNTNPIVKGRGSAIFLHIWKGKGIATEGCISMTEENIAPIIEWLDAAQKPYIIMGAEHTLKDFILSPTLP